jgi:hypothetical protein
LTRDPFAERLAGPRGDAILHGITGWQLMCLGIGVRTRFVMTWSGPSRGKASRLC